MTALNSFSPCEVNIRAIDGASRYHAWRWNEFAIFEDENDGDWLIAHLPSGSVLPFAFFRAVDAAGTTRQIERLRNDWTDVDHSDFLRLLPSIKAISIEHFGHAWCALCDEQPYNPCDFNGYGGAHVA